MKKVTGDMPSLNLVPAFEKMKAQCRNNKKIQNLEIPKIVGGEVQMLIGIKYQSIFPKHLHTFPNGLTVFKSQLKPTCPRALACIGGLVQALEHFCGIIRLKDTMSYMAYLVQSTEILKI